MERRRSQLVVLVIIVIRYRDIFVVGRVECGDGRWRVKGGGQVRES